METIEVVIKIPKEDYMSIKTVIEKGCEIPSFCYYYIASGIVLPKGHGRLKDIDQIINVGISKGFCDWYDEMEMADTIVKEDKEVENNGI